VYSSIITLYKTHTEKCYMTVELLKHLRKSLPEIECPQRRKRRRKIRNCVKRIRMYRKVSNNIKYHPVMISLMVLLYRICN